jgi:adenylate kinase
MMYGITGTPGTGKSAIAAELEGRGFPVLHLSDTTGRYVLEADPDRDTLVIDEERWAEEFPPFDGFVEGHLAHILACDRLIILRCRPDILAERLVKRGYTPEKVRENAEAEALDVVLIEALDCHPAGHIFEMDTTDRSIRESCDMIIQFVQGTLPPVHGTYDWSSYLGNL